MDTFQDILARPMEAIKEPIALPVGNYVLIVNGPFERVESKEKKTPGVRVKFKPMQAMSDVDQTALLAALDGKMLADKEIRYDFWITEGSAFMLKQFIENLGIEGASNMQEALAQIQGRQVIGTIAHRASEDGKRVFAELKAFAKV